MLALRLAGGVGVGSHGPDRLQRWERISLRSLGHRATERSVVAPRDPAVLLVAVLCYSVTCRRRRLDSLAHPRIMLLRLALLGRI